MILGLLLGATQLGYDLSSGMLDFCRSIPVTAMYPVFVLLFGIGHISKAAMVCAACLWVVTLNTAYGAIQANPTRRKMAALCGATPSQVFRLIVFYEALPQTLIGLRVALSYALIVEILAEMFMGSETGLGQRIVEAYTTYSMPQLWALIAVTGGVGLLLNRAFIWCERQLAPWVGRSHR
jgi:NitT/TauT family transport system permease protein